VIPPARNVEEGSCPYPKQLQNVATEYLNRSGIFKLGIVD